MMIVIIKKIVDGSDNVMFLTSFLYLSIRAILAKNRKRSCSDNNYDE